MKKKWQRGRMRSDASECAGAYLWVRTETDNLLEGAGSYPKGTLIYETHLVNQGKPVALPALVVVLLPEYADEITPEDFDHFRQSYRAQQRPAH